MIEILSHLLLLVLFENRNIYLLLLELKIVQLTLYNAVKPFLNILRFFLNRKYKVKKLN